MHVALLALIVTHPSPPDSVVSQLEARAKAMRGQPGPEWHCWGSYGDSIVTEDKGKTWRFHEGPFYGRTEEWREWDENGPPRFARTNR